MSYLLKKKLNQIKKRILRTHVLELTFSELCLYIQYRINKLLNTSVAATRAELKYSLCEVGPGRSRIDPWTLDLILQSKTFLDFGSIENLKIENEIFYFYSRDAKQGIEEAINLKKPIFRDISSLLQNQDAFKALSEKFRHIAQQNNYEITDTAYSTYSVDWKIDSEDKKLLIRLYNTQDWIYLNSEEIWSLVAKAHQDNRLPVLLAPFIHGACFLFFKRIGIIGRSLYRSFINREMPKIAPEKELLELNYSTGRYSSISNDELNEISSLLSQTVPSMYGTLIKSFSKGFSHSEILAQSKSCSDRNMQDQISSLQKVIDLLGISSRHKIRPLIQRYTSYLQS